MTSRCEGRGEEHDKKEAAAMKMKQIRNATLLIECGERIFLVDPMLAEKNTYPGFEGTVNSEQRNPLVNLTIPMTEIPDVDTVIVTHTHPDHWDDAAKNLLPIVLNCGDAQVVGIGSILMNKEDVN